LLPAAALHMQLHRRQLRDTYHMQDLD